jgi:hypothetical protein
MKSWRFGAQAKSCMWCAGLTVVPPVFEGGEPAEVALRAAKRAKTMTELYDAGAVSEAAAGRAVADVTVASLPVIGGGALQVTITNAINAAIGPAIAAAVAPVMQRLDAVEHRLPVDAIEQQQQRMAALQANQRLDSGNAVLHRLRDDACHFAPLLPQGTTVAQLGGMSNRHLSACLQHYGLPQAGLLDEKRERLRLRLGVRRPGGVGRRGGRPSGLYTP